MICHQRYLILISVWHFTSYPKDMENVQSLLGTIKTDTYTFDESLTAFKHPGNYFQDGRRIIDLVLAWKPSCDPKEHTKNKMRENVEKKLFNSGFDIEVTPFNNIVFMKLNVRETLIQKYAQTFCIKPPVKVYLLKSYLVG